MDRQRRRYGRREIIRRALLATGVLGMGLPAFLDPHSVVAAAAYPEARLAETGAEPLVDATLDFGFRLFGRLVALCNDLGLLSEEYDPHAQRQLGNFPQAFSHVALIITAFNLTRSEKPAEQRADLPKGTAKVAAEAAA